MSQDMNSNPGPSYVLLDDNGGPSGGNQAGMVSPSTPGQTSNNEDFYSNMRSGNQTSSVHFASSLPRSRPSPSPTSHNEDFKDWLQQGDSHISSSSSAKNLRSKIVQLTSSLLIFLTSVNGLDLSTSQLEFVKKYCLISIQKIVHVFKMKPRALLNHFELQDLMSDSNMDAMFRLYSLTRFVENYDPHTVKGKQFAIEKLPVLAADHEAFIKSLNMNDIWAYSQACHPNFIQIQLKVYEKIKGGG